MAKKLQLHGSFPSKAGDSAYQVAQKNGFKGTESEWLASLVGPEGTAGKDATSELVVQVTNDGTELVADKTYDEIASAYQAGKDVRCNFMAMVMPLVRVSETDYSFTCVYNAQLYTLRISSDEAVIISNEAIGGGDGTVKTVDGFSPDENGNVALNEYPVLLPQGTWRGSTDYPTLREIRFVENYSPDSYDETWDAGEVAGSITAYREGDILTVSANGKRKIKISSNAAGMFSSCRKLKTILGLEMLDASAVTHLGGAFVNCYELTSVDMSSWYCGEVTSIGGMFQYCHDLQSVKMPHGLNSETVTVTASVFEDCFKLREVDMANGPISVGDRMFAKCIDLEHASGLGAVTTVGTKAFIYCSNLKSIDLNPAILTSIGESAFRLSSVEDCINMDELNTACVIADYATRSKRWSDNAVLAAVQSKPIPTILLNVPHADSQKKYTNVKFGHRNVPWDDTENAVDVYIAEGGCSALSLYHEWQCIHHGTELEKDNFLHYWEAFEGDNFVNNNTEEMGDYFPVQAEMLGWGHSEEFITTADQYDVIIDRLNKHMPTCTIMRTAGNSGHHAVVIVGADALSRKLAVLDSAVTSESAVLTWVKFEDIFSGTDYGVGDYDRLVVHTYGDSFEGYESHEYISAPESASVGQTIVVKAVDESGKPTEWEAADMPSGGGTLTADDWVKITTVSFVKGDETVQHIITEDSSGNPFSYDEIMIEATGNDGAGDLTIWFNTTSKVSSDHGTLKDFCKFGVKPMVVISRIRFQTYLISSTVNYNQTFVTSSRFTETGGKIDIIALERAVTTNKVTLNIYGRSYK